MIIATSPRLVLRQFTIADAEQLAPILADPQVMGFSLAGPNKKSPASDTIAQPGDRGDYRTHFYE